MEQMNNLWLIVADIWQNGLYGVNIGNIIAALAIFTLFMFARALFTKLIMVTVGAWVKRTAWKHDDKVLDALQGPVNLIPVIIGVFVADSFLNAPEMIHDIVNNIVRSLIVFVIFWSFLNVFDKLAHGMRRWKRIFTPALLEWIIKAVKVFIFFLCGAIILEIWGVKVAPLLAGLGLFGMAVALASQDLFKNLIAGLLVIGEKRFEDGDWIRVDGVVEGTVERIGFRSTLIRRFDKAPVYVPNTKLSDSAVTNFSGMTHRRISWKIGVLYSSTIDQLKEIRDELEKYILENTHFANPEEASTFVRIDSFNSSSIDIMLYCFTNTTKWGEWLEIKEELAYKIKDIVEKAGSDFAFPSQTVYVEADGEKPEVFVPPSKK